MQLKILGLQGSTNINLITNATKNMNLEDAAAVLAKTGLTNAQKLSILSTKAESAEKAQNALDTATMQLADENAITAKQRLSLAAQSLGAALKAAAPLLLVASLVTLSSKFSEVEGNIGNASKLIVAAILLIGTITVFAIKMANTAIWGFMSSNPLGWILLAITAVVVAIKAVVEAIIGFANSSTVAKEKAVEAAKETKEAWEDAKEELEELNEELETSYERLEELQTLSDRGVITLVEQNELDKLKETIALLEAEKNALEATEQVKRQEAEKAAADAVGKILDEKLSDAYVQEDNTFWNGVGRSLASVLSLGISDAFGYGISDWSIKHTDTRSYVDDILEKMKNGEEVSEQQSQALNEFYQALGEQKDMLTYYSGDNLEQWQKDANEAYETYWEYIHKLNVANGKTESVWNHVLSMEKYDGVKEKLVELANAGTVTPETLRSLYDTNSAFKQMIDYLIELGIFSWQDTAKVNGLVNQVKAMADAGESAERQVDRLSQAISDYKSEIGTLQSAIDEYNKTGNVSTETYNKVIALNEDYADLFDYSNGKVAIVSDEVNKLVDELIAEYGATLAANGATEAQITQMVALAKSLHEVKEEADDVVDSIQDLADILKDATEGTEMSVFETWELITNYPELASAITKTTNGYILEEQAVRELIKAKAELLGMEASEARMSARDTLISNANNVDTANNVDKIFADYYEKNGSNISSFEEYEKAWESYYGKEATGNWINGLREYVQAVIQDNSVNDVMSSLIEDMKNPDTLLTSPDDAEENPISNAFDELEGIYSSRLQELDYLENTYNNAIRSLENQGYDVPTSYYEKLKEVEEKKIALLGEELNALTAKFQEAITAGEIQEGTQEYYDMNNAINSVKESIQASNLALQEYSNTIRDLEWEKFDKIQDEISKITEESEFLLDLLDDKELVDKSGKLTEYGDAAMGLHGVNYNVYMEQAKRYAEELADIEEELANDVYNQTLIDRKEELLGLQRESILAAEEEKQAMVDLVKDGIEAELDALDDLIEKYTDALDSAKDLYDYQNKVSDATEEIAKLQKMIIAYENDTSEETKAQIQQLKVDLQKAQEELQETEYDQFIADQKKLLDNLYTDYETILNRRIDDVDTLIIDSINAINNNATDIKATLESTVGGLGITLSDKMNSIWTVDDEIKTVVSTYSSNFDTNAENVNGSLGTINSTIGTMNGVTTTISSTLSGIDTDIGTTNTTLSNINTAIGGLAGKLASEIAPLINTNNAGDATNNGSDDKPSGSEIKDTAPNTVYTDPKETEPKKEETTTTKNRWTSYQDAVDAGYSNILGASGSEKSRAVQQYGSYQNYLDAMYYKYMGKNPDGVSSIPQKVQQQTTTTTQPKEKMVEYSQTGLRIGTKTYSKSKYDSKVKVVDGVTYLSTHENGAQWSDRTDLYVKKGEGYDVTKEANGKVDMDWHSFKPVYQLQQYKKGGLADYTGLAWMDGTKTKPEMVLDAEDTQNFIALRDMLSAMMGSDISYGNPLYSSFAPMSYKAGMPELAEKMAQMTSNYGETKVENHVEITIPIEKVEDYNDFVTQLQKDPKFEKMIQAMTIGRMNGGSQLDKYNYQWGKKK